MNLSLLKNKQNQKARRCERNRNRSKRRQIYCPIHLCYLDSTSEKYYLYADRADQLRQQGYGKLNAELSIKSRTTIPLKNEWIEEFWCSKCQKKEWYHVHKQDRTYNLSIASGEIWQRATGVSPVYGNPSVGEFTRRQAQKLKIR